jgi:methionyl-tRNA synthetase
VAGGGRQGGPVQAALRGRLLHRLRAVLRPSDLVNGQCPEHDTPTEQIAEENWFFRLSAYQDYLHDLISSDRLRVRPEPFRREVLAFIRAGLADISVSRSVARARGWGIPVPDDPSQVIYVWFDALTNYISALGFGRPGRDDYRQWWVEADHRVHVIGKGILRFHAVYWPAFLESAGQPAPTRIQVHPYLTAEGRKLSKSHGGNVDPEQLVGLYGQDALRWWLARDVGEVADTDFTVGRLIDRANADLANALGNSANRIATLVHRSLDGRVNEVLGAAPAGDDHLGAAVTNAIAEFRLRDATRLVVQAVAALDAELTATEPWRLAREPSRRDELERFLARQVAAARAIALVAHPIVPELAERLQHQLGEVDGRLPSPRPVFARI